MPSGNWEIVDFKIMRLMNDQHPHSIDWEDVTVIGLMNFKENLMIVQNFGDAFDMEYWTRGCEFTRKREIVDYSDLDLPDITDEMYAANLNRQYPHVEIGPLETMEREIDLV